MNPERPFPVVILTGLSGAGKSTALHVFEDLRFYCVDGLPASLLPKLADLFGAEKARRYRGLALGIDIRQSDFISGWQDSLTELASVNIAPQIIFLEAQASVLMRRYATTRRLHPLESHELGLEQALDTERKLLAPVRQSAHLVIDTSDYSIHDLRRVLQEKWSFLERDSGGLRVHLISFGYKYGVPLEADLVFDLRFLPNPYFDKSLKELSGKDERVSDFVLNNETGTEFLQKYLDFLLFVLPLYAREGRYRLSLALGCTGGRHRSVSVAEAVLAELQARGYDVFLEHRHLDLG